MSATEAIRAARTAGVRLTADGEDLLLDAASPPPPAVIEKLSRHKAEVLKLLRPVGSGWSAADWHAFFDERAGIAEFDDGLSRSEAEDHAFACSVSEWLNRNPVTSPPGRCVACGDREYGYDPLLPYGVEPTGHAWLHSRWLGGLARRPEKGGRRGTQGNGGWEADLQRNERWAGAGGPKKF
ncbi:MAG: hypothetical protein QOD29_3640 [Alphaproteobacteria bacterium]|nr:hypothetical protein [Alphaproteobacteria bacterium]